MTEALVFLTGCAVGYGLGWLRWRLWPLLDIDDRDDPLAVRWRLADMSKDKKGPPHA